MAKWQNDFNYVRKIQLYPKGMLYHPWPWHSTTTPGAGKGPAAVKYEVQAPIPEVHCEGEGCSYAQRLQPILLGTFHWGRGDSCIKSCRKKKFLKSLFALHCVELCCGSLDLMFCQQPKEQLLMLNDGKGFVNHAM